MMFLTLQIPSADPDVTQTSRALSSVDIPKVGGE